jgi:hypothetical protein
VVGAPHPFFLLLMTIELALPPLLVLLWWRAGTTARRGSRPRSVSTFHCLGGREASEQQAATAQMGAAEQRYEAALLDIQSALGEALARLKAARQANALVARKALPEARAALKSVTADYA